MQLGCVGEFSRQHGQAVVPQGENAERHTASNLRWQHLKVVPVHIKIGQLGQLAQRAGQGLARRRDQRLAEAP
jgi:hypothetical protein